MNNAKKLLIEASDARCIASASYHNNDSQKNAFQDLMFLDGESRNDLYKFLEGFKH